VYLQNIKGGIMMSVLDNFTEWKSFLNDRVEQARKMGMNDETMNNVAYQFADYLSDKVDPQNEEERLLKELWESADEQQQKTLASILIKYVDKHH
jgi:Asp/Glu/hydantoin racemase